MKYIRTKDERIIDATKYYIENSNLFKSGAYQEYKKELANAYKQADTIEELCDEFIITDYTTIPKRCDVGIKKLFDSKSKYLTIELDSYGQRHGYDLMTFLKTKPKCCIFGAIWTDKGLIYVAKMNEKGELELL